jgi:hypothetical protein
MSGIAGLRGTGNWGTDERPKNFRESILFFSPNGNAPIFGLSSKAGKKTVDDPEFSWWAEPQTLVRLQVAGALISTDTTVTVDSTDPTAQAAGANYGTATHLKPGDILLVEPASDNATFNHELLEVENVLSDTQFTVKRGAGGTSPASIGNDIWLSLIGSAYAEGTGAPQAVSRNPVKYTNYTQIFKDSYELSKTADVTKARTGSAWSNDKKRKGFDHARAIEMSILFGRKAETTGENGKPKRFMGGLREFIPSANVTVFSSAMTPSSFAAAVAPVFNFESGGGNTRIMFMGNEAAINLSTVMNSATNTNLNYNGGFVNVYGLNFQRFILPNGELLVKTHPLLSIHPLYKKSAFIVDFDSLKWVSLSGRDTKPFDDVQAKDEDVRRGYYLTEGSLMVDRGGLTMGYLGNMVAS